MSRSVLVLAAIVLAGSVSVLFAALVGGTAGLLVVALLIAATAVVAVRWRLGRDERPSRPHRALQWPLEPFHAYRRIEFGLSWGRDRSSRDCQAMLRRATRAVLARRRGIDLDRDPGAARQLLGDAAWALLDPGPDVLLNRSDVTGLVEALEELVTEAQDKPTHPGADSRGAASRRKARA